MADSTQNNLEILSTLNDIIDLNILYVLVKWPYSQDFREEEWFDNEAVLGDNSSYFIPINRIFES